MNFFKRLSRILKTLSANPSLVNRLVEFNGGKISYKTILLLKVSRPIGRPRKITE